MPERRAKPRCWSIFLIVFIDLIGFGMVLPLLPLYAKHFQVDESGVTIGLLMASFSAMQFLFAPMWGRLSDRVGRRPVLMVGLAGSVVFYFLFAVASIYESLALLFVSRIGAGIAGATISTAHAYIADVTTLENRTKGMALIGAAFGWALRFGPLFAVAGHRSSKGNGLGPGPGYAASAPVGRCAAAGLVSCCASRCAPGRPHAARKWFDFQSLAEACRMPSVGLLLLTSFICVFSFANFESRCRSRCASHFEFGLPANLPDIRLHRHCADAGARRHRAPAGRQSARSGAGSRRGRAGNRRLFDAVARRRSTTRWRASAGRWRSSSAALHSSRPASTR